MRFTSSGSRVGNWKGYTSQDDSFYSRCIRVTYVDVVLLTLLVGALGYSSNPACYVPR